MDKLRRDGKKTRKKLDLLYRFVVYCLYLLEGSFFVPLFLREANFKSIQPEVPK